MDEVEKLIAELNDPDAKVRKQAATELGETGDGRAVESLINALNTWEPPGTRQFAATALGEIGDPRAVEPLIAALRRPYMDVQATALFALQRIGTPAIKPLISVLHDLDTKVRWLAAFGLEEIGDLSALPELDLLAQAESEDKDWNLPEIAREASARIRQRMKNKSGPAVE